MTNPPRLIVVGGPNGAGKTTLAQANAGERGIRYLGADELASQLDPDTPATARIAAARLFSAELRDAFDRSESLVVESTLAGRSLGRHLQRALQRGYSIASGWRGGPDDIMDETLWGRLLRHAAPGDAHGGYRPPNSW